MANNKTGFLYYSTDTDRYQDRRIKRLKKHLNCEGITIYDYLLCEIYRDKGCFIKWSDDLSFDISEYFGLDESMIIKIRDFCIEIGLFSSIMFEKFSVLTSLSIQERYKDMCQRSKRKVIIIPEEFIILPEKSIIIQEESIIIQEKIDIPFKNQKIKENKIKEIPPNPLKGEDCDSSFFYPFIEFWEDYDKKVGDVDSLELEWNKISLNDRILIKDHVKKYKISQPVKRYRKNIESYLKQRSWKDEIIISENKAKDKKLLTYLEVCKQWEQGVPQSKFEKTKIGDKTYWIQKT